MDFEAIENLADPANNSMEATAAAPMPISTASFSEEPVVDSNNSSLADFLKI